MNWVLLYVSMGLHLGGDRAMAKKMTWEEIQKQYPDQWVSLVDVDYISEGIVKSGIVTAAGSDLKIVVQQLKEKNLQSDRFTYTGSIKHFFGFAEWTITDVPTHQ